MFWLGVYWDVLCSYLGDLRLWWRRRRDARRTPWYTP